MVEGDDDGPPRPGSFLHLMMGTYERLFFKSSGFENEVQEVDEEEFAQAVSCPGMELFE